MDDEMLQQRLADLERRGAGQAAPLQFQYLRALTRRWPRLAAELQAALEPRLLAALGACEEAARGRRGAARPGVGTGTGSAAGTGIRSGTGAGSGTGRGMGNGAGIANGNAKTRPAASPLGLLNIELATRHFPQIASQDGRPELASAARFRRAYQRQHAMDSIHVAQSRRPANAGPLNSHAIAVECLSLMRELSPDYLRHFMQQVDALQHLAALQAALPPALGPRPSERRTAARRKPKGKTESAGKG